MVISLLISDGLPDVPAALRFKRSTVTRRTALVKETFQGKLAFLLLWPYKFIYLCTVNFIVRYYENANTFKGKFGTRSMALCITQFLSRDPVPRLTGLSTTTFLLHLKITLKFPARHVSCRRLLFGFLSFFLLKSLISLFRGRYFTWRSVLGWHVPSHLPHFKDAF